VGRRETSPPEPRTSALSSGVADLSGTIKALSSDRKQHGPVPHPERVRSSKGGSASGERHLEHSEPPLPLRGGMARERLCGSELAVLRETWGSRAAQASPKGRLASHVRVRDLTGPGHSRPSRTRASGHGDPRCPSRHPHLSMIASWRYWKVNGDATIGEIDSDPHGRRVVIEPPAMNTSFEETSQRRSG